MLDHIYFKDKIGTIRALQREVAKWKQRLSAAPVLLVELKVTFTYGEINNNHKNYKSAGSLVNNVTTSIVKTVMATMVTAVVVERLPCRNADLYKNGNEIYETYNGFRIDRKYELSGVIYVNEGCLDDGFSVD